MFAEIAFCTCHRSVVVFDVGWTTAAATGLVCHGPATEFLPSGQTKPLAGTYTPDEFGVARVPEVGVVQLVLQVVAVTRPAVFATTYSANPMAANGTERAELRMENFLPYLRVDQH